jgi:hypothetical protein
VDPAHLHRDQLKELAELIKKVLEIKFFSHLAVESSSSVYCRVSHALPAVEVATASEDSVLVETRLAEKRKALLTPCTTSRRS